MSNGTHMTKLEVIANHSKVVKNTYICGEQVSNYDIYPASLISGR